MAQLIGRRPAALRYRGLPRASAARYCAVVDQNGEGWAERLAAAVGQRVKYFREQAPKVSAQTLADRCAAIGHPLDRSVIAKLERGSRQSVTMAEILVLARALRVTPALLVYPVGAPGAVEVLPGVEADSWAAAKWLAGIMTEPQQWGSSRAGNMVDAGRLWKDERRDVAWIVPTFQTHDRYVSEWANSRKIAAQARLRAGGDVAEDARDALLREAEERERAAQQWEQALVIVREDIRAGGLTPPTLPPALLHLDDESGDGDDEA